MTELTLPVCKRITWPLFGLSFKKGKETNREYQISLERAARMSESFTGGVFARHLDRGIGR